MNTENKVNEVEVNSTSTLIDVKAFKLNTVVHGGAHCWTTTHLSAKGHIVGRKYTNTYGLMQYFLKRLDLRKNADKQLLQNVLDTLNSFESLTKAHFESLKDSKLVSLKEITGNSDVLVRASDDKDYWQWSYPNTNEKGEKYLVTRGHYGTMKLLCSEIIEYHIRNSSLELDMVSLNEKLKEMQEKALLIQPTVL